MSWLKNKIKFVATKAQDAIIQGIDAMAPTLYESDVKEFHQRWLTVRHFMDAVLERNVADLIEQKRILRDSNTPESLQKMVMLLCTEEMSMEHQEAGLDASTQTNAEDSMQSYRPCLEYLLENQIVPYLCDIGKRDQPRGFMSLSLQFISAILEKLEYPILPTREIHVAIIALVESAILSEVGDILIQKCLVRLLYSIWKKLRINPVQIEFFFVYPEANEYEEDFKSKSEAFTNEEERKRVFEFNIFSGLLRHMYADGVIGDRCRETIVIAAGIPEASLAQFIIHLTPFCHDAISGLVVAYDALPRNFVSNNNNNRAEAKGLQHSKSKYLDIFLVRLRFCCSLSLIGNTETFGTEPTSISTIITQLFSDLFLKSTYLPAMLSTSEPTILATTLYARIIMEELGTFGRDLECNPFLLLTCRVLLDQSSDIPSVVKESSRPVFLELIGRIDSLSSSLSIATMDLISFMLEIDDPLVDSWLLNRPAGDTRMVEEESSQTTSIKQARQHEAVWFASHFPNASIASHVHLWKTQGFSKHMEIGEVPEIVSSGESENSKNQVVSILTYIVDAEYMATRRIPSILGASAMSDEEGRTECEQIKSKALLSWRNVQQTENHSIPSNALESAEHIPPLLQSVFSKLERLLEHSFLENLSLSGLVSILSQKSNLVDVVFDFEDTKDGQSIRGILEKVHRDAMTRLTRIPDGSTRLEEVRQSLKKNESTELVNQEPEIMFLCGFVILDEILKEMCSFLFAMERAQSLPLKPEGFYMEPNTRMTFIQTQENSVLESENRLGRVTSSSEPTADKGTEVDLEAMIIEAEATITAMLNRVS
uniref:Uncharacterized protein AlNc14C296G10310 n=1 Tax=Albugo laibachii Nc14 TaxID=890382 RepID=F0WVH5_9STRA|nr:conserved hypothetical protein [Albugo laibachii Nc14]|eukprot:CCA25416.1 conserved hypothetical protein [Albugo laibachii Nc14]